MKSIMSKDFSRNATTDIERSTFDRSHGLKTAFDSGYLVPIELQEVVPSDEVNFRLRALARLAPVVTPVMDNVFLDIHAFFVPSRLLWNNFTKMMGERKNPNDSIDYLIPQAKIKTGSDKVGSLADYFGLPIQQASGSEMSVSALPFRAYQKIYDDWFRDENLQDSVIQSSDELGDAVISTSVSADSKWFELRKRGKRHDYFTSALPWPQRGDAVNLPLGGTAGVVTREVAIPAGQRSSNPLQWYDISTKLGYQASEGGLHSLGVVSGGRATAVHPDGSAAVAPTQVAPVNLFADLSTATAATVNSLRTAFQIQRYLEASARGGCSRYVEIIRTMFKTICPDARLQRSEFLGSRSVKINFTPIAQTSSTTETSPQGNLAATAHAYDEDFTFHRAFTEHGYILVLASVRCDLNYQQGIDRLWSRQGRFDFYWPQFAHLGEQEVRNKEIFFSGTDDDDGVFGYQERYAEMRYNPSRITGKFRSGVQGSLDVWHLAQDFSTLPVLSPEFIVEDPPLDRVLAVTEGEPQILLDCYLEQRWTRPMPVFSIPGLIDHF